jgi:ABC-type oligopeptide transport system substrate-binding subunit
MAFAPWAPKHYLRQYHITYNPDADALADDEGYGEWWENFTAHSAAGNDVRFRKAMSYAINREEYAERLFGFSVFAARAVPSERIPKAAHGLADLVQNVGQDEGDDDKDADADIDGLAGLQFEHELAVGEADEGHPREGADQQRPFERADELPGAI